MAQQFYAHWRSRAGRDGRKPDWLAMWRVFVRHAGAGDRSLYSGANGALPAQRALPTGSDRTQQVS